MLARQFRLPISISFQKARVLRFSLMTARFVSNNLSHNRYGFIAGKKLDKRAVVRNRVKRRVRSVVEKEGLKLKGKDVLFILSPALKDASFSEISSQVCSILDQLS